MTFWHHAAFWLLWAAVAKDVVICLIARKEIVALHLVDPLTSVYLAGHASIVLVSPILFYT